MNQSIEQAVDILRNGGLIAYPTDTVYGLGADALSESAVMKVYTVKGRAFHLALPLLLADVSQIEGVARDVPEIAWRLAQRFLPGGLTMVLHKASSVPNIVTGDSDKIAIRVPNHPIPIALIEGLGSPITGTSANTSGSPDPLTADDIRAQVGDKIDLVIDGGRCPGGLASTVIDLTVEPPVILREGAIGRDDIERTCEVASKEA